MIEHLRAEALAGFEEQWHFSHVVRCRGLLLLSEAIGCSELITPGALVEIRAVAVDPRA